MPVKESYHDLKIARPNNSNKFPNIETRTGYNYKLTPINFLYDLKDILGG
jgi:hypothetical protein